ncbi:MAG: DUF1648 domain-containing protein [Maribacter sp.]|nr:DUF1648 domain-containing protein [Maribacter sp.]
MTPPNILITKNWFDKLILILSFIFILSSVLLILINYKQLPDSVPIYFNTPQKDADGFGNKNLLWELPVILGIIILLLNRLSQYPRIFNYPIKVNEENAAFNYKMGSQMLRVLGLGIGFVCFSLTMMSILNAKGNHFGLEKYLNPILIGLLIGIPILYLGFILRKKFT